MAKSRLQGRPPASPPHSPGTPSANPGKPGPRPPLPDPSLREGCDSSSQQAPRGPRRPASSRCGSARLGVCHSWAREPRPPPHPWLPAPSGRPRVPAPASSAPAPPPVARALPAPPPSSRAASTTNEVRGRVRRFKRRLLREAGREIRRWGQNLAGACEPCRAACCGERAGVGARGEEAERRREGPAEGGSAPADMLGASLTGPGRG